MLISLRNTLTEAPSVGSDHVSGHRGPAALTCERRHRNICAENVVHGRERGPLDGCDAGGDTSLHLALPHACGPASSAAPRGPDGPRLRAPRRQMTVSSDVPPPPTLCPSSRHPGRVSGKNDLCSLLPVSRLYSFVRLFFPSPSSPNLAMAQCP